MEYAGVEALPRKAGRAVARMAASRNRFTLQASHEAARAENSLRVKDVFYFLHLRKVGIFRPPDFQARFPGRRAPRNHGLAAEFRTGLVNGAGCAYDGFP